MAIERLIHYVDSLHAISRDLNQRLAEASPVQRRCNKHINIVLPEMRYHEGVFVLNGLKSGLMCSLTFIVDKEAIMARQISLIKLEGTIGDLTFYKIKNGGYQLLLALKLY